MSRRHMVKVIVCSFSGFMYFVLSVIAYGIHGKLMPTNFPPDPDYPLIYHIAQKFILICAGAGVLIFAVVYLHISARLQNICAANDHFKPAKPAKIAG